MIRNANGIEHRLIKPNHPWSAEGLETVRRAASPKDSQVERMHSTIKDAAVRCFHCDSQDQLRTHLDDVIAGRNRTKPAGAARSAPFMRSAAVAYAVVEQQQYGPAQQKNRENPQQQPRPIGKLRRLRQARLDMGGKIARLALAFGNGCLIG